MSTYTQILYHIVFGTKYRARCLHISWPKELKALLKEHGVSFDENDLL